RRTAPEIASRRIALARLAAQGRQSGEDRRGQDLEHGFRQCRTVSMASRFASSGLPLLKLADFRLDLRKLSVDPRQRLRLRRGAGWHEALPSLTFMRFGVFGSEETVVE